MKFVSLLQNQHRSAAKSPALEFTDGMETVIVFTDATLERRESGESFRGLSTGHAKAEYV